MALQITTSPIFGQQRLNLKGKNVPSHNQGHWNRLTIFFLLYSKWLLARMLKSKKW
jgi:hypothetical protein